jgi:hypothetical protein
MRSGWYLDLFGVFRSSPSQPSLLFAVRVAIASVKLFEYSALAGGMRFVTRRALRESRHGRSHPNLRNAKKMKVEVPPKTARKPCRKFRKASVVEFVSHIHKDKCPQCLAVARYLGTESRLALAMWQTRN